MDTLWHGWVINDYDIVVFNRFTYVLELFRLTNLEERAAQERSFRENLEERELAQASFFC